MVIKVLVIGIPFRYTIYLIYFIDKLSNKIHRIIKITAARPGVLCLFNIIVPGHSFCLNINIGITSSSNGNKTKKIL